jgi:TetR/AcrR family transcriptional repressor of nem operon
MAAAMLRAAPARPVCRRDAGLTHGGLYRHFASKDALVQEACARAFDWSIAPLDDATPNTTVSERIRSYLSARHRDAPGQGCPVAALAVDAARVGGGLSEVFADGIERNIGRFAQLLAEGRGEEGRSEGSSAKGGADSLAPQDRARAVQFLATMVGGLVLARATAAARPALSDELLATLQAQLVALLDDGAR